MFSIFLGKGWLVGPRLLVVTDLNRDREHNEISADGLTGIIVKLWLLWEKSCQQHPKLDTYSQRRHRSQKRPKDSTPLAVSLCKRSPFLTPTRWGRRWCCSSSSLYLLFPPLYSCNSVFILVSALNSCLPFFPPLFHLHSSVWCLTEKLKHRDMYLWPLYLLFIQK